MRKISVLYDREIFLNQKFGGISKAFVSLFKELSHNQESKIIPNFSFSRSDNYYLRDLEFPEFERARKFFPAKSGWSTLSTLGPIRDASSKWAAGPVPITNSNILHATYYRPTSREKSRGEKLVVTVHDFIPEKLGWTGLRNPHFGKKSLCSKADLIICVSSATATDLLNYYSLPEHKIRVIPHGVDVDLSAVAKNITNLIQRPSILYVGHRSGYKNFKVLLSAIRIGLTRDLDFQLVTAGPRLSRDEISENSDLLTAGVWNHQEAPSELQLRELYKKSTFHCVTSKMEGFGMTILESMSVGTPVILSCIPVFKEVAGDAGVYFDPESGEDLLTKLVQLLDNHQYVSQSSSSLSHVAFKGWDVNARHHENAYVALMKNSI